MAHLIKLPAVAADTTGGTLHQWLKQEGDAVAVGEAIAEVETEKAIVEISAEHAGVLGRIVVPAGSADVAVNAVLGVILEAGEDASAIEQALREQGAEAARGGAPAAKHVAQEGSGKNAKAPGRDAAASAGAEPAKAAPEASAASTTAAAGPAELGQGRILASPLARRLAREWHIALDTLAGSGPHGRIVRRDVQAARDSGVADAATAAALPRGQPQRIPHTGMRRAIARRLSESKQQVPHFYLSVDCRMDALLALRAQANQDGALRLSVNDFIVRAAAQALRDVPEVNVSWEEDAIVRHAGADISVAVATDGGLVTPIVRDADAKTLPAVSDEIAELAARAKVNRLRPDEFTGGSLTVSNLGMYGIREFAAIINPPQAAILAVGAAEQRAVVADDGSLAAATIMTATLSADHRAVDGAVGARWLAAFRQRIENPVRILL